MEGEKEQETHMQREDQKEGGICESEGRRCTEYIPRAIPIRKVYLPGTS